MNKAFEVAVREALERDVSLEEFVEILRTWRDNGLTQEIALRTLGLLRDGTEEELEDRILEIMDVASGFCRPDLRVWDTPS